MDSLEDLEFDPKKFRLGRLCKRGHDWDGTGKTLRRISGNCLQCEHEHHVAYYWANREADLARSAAWREANREKIREFGRDYREKNADKIQAWKDANRERLNADARHRNVINRERNNQRHREFNASEEGKAYNRMHMRRYRQTEKGKSVLRVVDQKKRSKRKGVHRAPYLSVELNARFQQFDHSCAYCGTGGLLDADHFLPLSRGGSDTLPNIVPACRSCNS